jgi:hypothetical protein
MTVAFDFRETGTTVFGKIYTPVAEVTFISPNTGVSAIVTMIVDSGADFTIVPRYIAHKLDISLEKDCFKETVSGVGGTQTIYLLKKRIRTKIGGMTQKIPLAIFDTNETPALLGRLGFMELFDVLLSRGRKTKFSN